MTQLTNLRNLLAVGERILAERLPIGFGRFDCGTFACFLGWYDRIQGTRLQDEAGFEEGHFDITSDDWSELFGWTHEDYWPGLAAYASLEARLVYLRQLIADREPKFTGLPSMVRALFEGEAVKS